MKKAIAVTPIWNHRTAALVEPGEELEMEDNEIDSLIEIEAAKEISAVKAKPVEE